MKTTRLFATIALILAGLMLSGAAFARPMITRDEPQLSNVPSLPGDGGIAESVAETMQEIETEGIEALAGEPECGWVRALVPVAVFLGLEEGQAGMLVQLLQQRRIAVEPIAWELRQREAALAELLQAAEPDSALVGQMVLEIRELRRAVVAIQIEFLLAFEQLLDLEQRQRLALIRAAIAVRPVLPAFVGLHLI